ncbi:MAG: hypothetical protein ACE5Z5_07060 [Candidatus Bathyarchaeia archaeon]
MSERTEQITIRVSAEEKNLAKKLAEYLHKAGKLDDDSIASGFRISLRYTVNEILKSVEVERYGE